jgi:hypothetical protein
MGVYKRLYLQKTNRKVILRIKSYSYYRKDIWGLLRWKKLFKHKKAVYNILKIVRKFYNIILQQVYKGVHFNVKRYGYIGTLFFAKRLLRLYYGNLRESFFGKLGRLIKRKSGILVNYFFGLLERRLDVLLVRAFFTNKVIWARRYIIFINVFISKIRICLPNFLVRIGDVVSVKSNPAFIGFFNFNKDTFSVKDFRSFRRYRSFAKNIRLKSLVLFITKLKKIFFVMFRCCYKRTLRTRFRFKRVSKNRYKKRIKGKKLLVKVMRLKKNRLKKKRLSKPRRTHSGVKHYLFLLRKRYAVFRRFFFKIHKVFEGLEKSGFRYFFKFSYFFFLKFFRRLRLLKNLGRLTLLKNFRKFFLLIRFLLSERHGDQGLNYLRCLFRASFTRSLIFHLSGGSIPIQRQRFLLSWSSRFLRVQIFFGSVATKDDYVYFRRFKGAYVRSFLLFRKIRVIRLLIRKFFFNRKYREIKKQGTFSPITKIFNVYSSRDYKRHRFSLSQYKLVKRNRSFYFSAVSPFLEVNYKIRKFTVFKIPSPVMLKYPFGVRSTFLYTYYKRRAFF